METKKKPDTRVLSLTVDELCKARLDALERLADHLRCKPIVVGGLGTPRWKRILVDSILKAQKRNEALPRGAGR